MADPWTRRELIDQALDNLGVLVEGQTVPDELVSKVDKVLDPCMEQLRARDIVDVTAPSTLGTDSPPAAGEFPLELCLPLSHCLAWAAASKFNLAGDPALKVMNDQSEDLLQRMTAAGRTRRMLRVDKGTRQGNRWGGRGSFANGT